MLASLREYTLIAQSFSAAAQRIAQVFGIDRLESPIVWSSLLDKANMRPNIITIYQDIRDFRNNAARVLKLIEQESVQAWSEAHKSQDNSYINMSVFSITVPENDSDFSDPEQIVDAIQSVQLIYIVCARKQGLSPDGLRLLSCDSGSDKLFQFIGVKDILDCVRQTFIDIYDRAIEFGQRRQTARVKTIAETLPVLGDIQKACDSGIISAEEATILRRKLLIGVDKAFSAHVTTSEMQTRVIKPRELMSSPTLLLSVGKEVSHEITPDEIILDGEVVINDTGVITHNDVGDNSSIGSTGEDVSSSETDVSADQVEIEDDKLTDEERELLRHFRASRSK